MAEEVPEIPQSVEGGEPVSAVDMELDAGSPQNPKPNGVAKPEANGGGGVKRERKEEEEEDEDGELKRPKVERSLEEERLEKLEEKEKGDEDSKAEKENGVAGDEKGSATARLGPKEFSSSVEMFDYFYKLLHSWSPEIDLNEYEHMVLLDLLKKGHPEPAKKIGDGIQAFKVRYHPLWQSRCFFLVRVDESVDDFSFGTCVDNILSLPDNMKLKSAKRGNGAIDGKETRGHKKSGGHKVKCRQRRGAR